MTALLMTGAIDIAKQNVPFTALTTLEDRLAQYLRSLDYAIRNYRTTQEIVFCENTNYSYDFTPWIDLAKQHGKKLEIVSFQGDYNGIQQRGKGYGEGEAIVYALQHSAILKESNSFYKLTGRLMVANFDQLDRDQNEINRFIFHPKKIYNNRVDHVETYFYRVDKGFYQKHLADVYRQVDELNYRYLEHLFFEQLNGLPIRSFHKRPAIEGNSGTSGNPYFEGRKAKWLERINYTIGVHHIQQTRFEQELTTVWAKALKFRRLFK